MQLNRRYPNCEKIINANRKKLEAHFSMLIKGQGSVVVDIATTFWHCYK